MRKLFTLILALASFGFAGFWSEAKATTAASVVTPQVRIQIDQRDRNWRYRRWRNREFRNRNYGYGQAFTQTRLVRRGWATYRETYLTRYLSNGLTQTTLISRVRVS
jgi:hypothetical protein